MSGSPRAVDVSMQARDFVDLVRRAKEFDAQLGTSLRRNLRNAGKIAATAAQQEIQTGWPRGTVHHGVRAGIAAGIGVQVASGESAKRVGVFIVASGKGLPAAQRPLVRKFNRASFKHPVFGKAVWVTQPGHLYFDQPIRAKAPQVQALIEQAMGDALKAITS